MRVLVAADHAAGYFATKAYHIIQGAGVRYVVTLYRLSDGELLAMLDGQIITDLRTGAASGVIARRVKIDGAVSVGILGSGNQAHTQLESIAAVYNVESADVYSPTVQNREAYARDMSAKLGIKVKAVSSAEQAARGHQVVIAASSARRQRTHTARGVARRMQIAVRSRQYTGAIRGGGRRLFSQRQARRRRFMARH
jgi:ornithine cyclodeaminase/alanine dehydrogenase-like protein (mu-crystallin family)